MQCANGMEPSTASSHKLAVMAYGSPNPWSGSDELALSLFCCGGAMSLILSQIEKTPDTVAVLVFGIAGILIYPILHFVPSKMPRITALIGMLLLVGTFGWSVWPEKARHTNKCESYEYIRAGSITNSVQGIHDADPTKCFIINGLIFDHNGKSIEAIDPKNPPRNLPPPPE